MRMRLGCRGVKRMSPLSMQCRVRKDLSKGSMRRWKKETYYQKYVEGAITEK